MSAGQTSWTAVETPTGSALNGHRPDPAPTPPPSSTWGRVDLTGYLDGRHEPQVPELLTRADGRSLLYRGRVHSFHGESESGKSFVALAATAELLADGGRVVMLDFESDPGTVTSRLLALGVLPVVIRNRFDYRRPETRPNAQPESLADWSELLTRRTDLVVIDGVTEVLSLFGVLSKDNDAVTEWIRSTPRRLAEATGAAVLLIDHVTKDADSRGRFAIGGQAKMAALDGAAYVVEVLEPLGVGLLGRVALRVAKDRPGEVRPHAGPYRKGDRTQQAAVVSVDSRTPGRTVVTVDPPQERLGDTPSTTPGATFRPTALMERVSVALEKANAAMSRTGIERAVSGKTDAKRQAVEVLLSEGYLLADGPSLNGGRPTIRSVKPYRQGADPALTGRGGVR